MKLNFVVLGLLVVSVTGVGGADPSPTTLQYEPAIVELSGSISLEVHYGPPNFGENPKTDKKEQVPILKLQLPISVQGDPKNDLDGDSFNNVDHLQLLMQPSQSLKEYMDKKVTVKGTLFEKQSGENFTDVLMNVQKITLMP
jgi:hypothetical protein